MPEVPSHILIGLKSSSLLSHQLTEQEMLDAGLNLPFFSPELQVWRSPLSQKLIITVGINHELIELHNNFPRFSLLHHKEESDKEILARVNKQGKLILERIKELKFDDNHIFLSNEKPDSKEVIILGGESHPSGTYNENESEPSKPVLESVEHTTSRDTEEKESYFDNLDTGIEESCNHCTLMFEQPGQIKENDGFT